MNTTPTPTSPPKPSPETVAKITEPPMRRGSTWAFVAAVIAGLPPLLNLWAPLLTTKQSAALAAVCGTLGGLAAILARVGAVDAAGRVAEGAAGNLPGGTE